MLDQSYQYEVARAHFFKLKGEATAALSHLITRSIVMIRCLCMNLEATWLWSFGWSAISAYFKRLHCYSLRFGSAFREPRGMRGKLESKNRWNGKRTRPLYRPDNSHVRYSRNLVLFLS